MSDADGGDADVDDDVRDLLRGLAHAPAASAHDVIEPEFTDEGARPRERTALLPAGTIVGGRFVIDERIGVGGAGEVYRARDERLGRAVALKVLATAVTEERLQRFEVEAQAVAALSHPNVLEVHDVGKHDGVPYMVLELLDGETLRQRLRRGQLPIAEAIALTRQIAEGLAATHERGLVHRDLKPENLFLVGDRRVKILDFGLAKLVGPDPITTLPEAITAEGHVLGTVSYMSPEQLRGERVDHRSDVFALGAILVEMLRGRPAFEGRTQAEIVTAILRDEPVALDGRALPRGLLRVVRHCLDKRVERRFQSARDLAFALDALDPDELVPPRRARRRFVAGGALAAFGATLGVALVAMRSGGRDAAEPAAAPIGPPLALTRLTFERGNVTAARFAPDGKTVVYSAGWRGMSPELFTTRAGVFESRPLGIGTAELLAVSPEGELAVKTRIVAHSVWGFWSMGSLALAPLAGGAPREHATNVTEAEFLPDGSLVVVRRLVGEFVLEWPVGRVVARTRGWLGQPRRSPAGDAVAVADHPEPEDDGGSVALIAADGTRRTLTRHYLSVQGVAWHGDEVWFTATTVGAARELRAVTRSGEERLIEAIPGTLRLYDAAADGRLLLAREDIRSRVFAGELADTAQPEHELSWLDGSAVVGLSADGSRLLFTESWDGGGRDYASFVRATSGAEPAVRLGTGAAYAISDDGAWVLTVNHRELTLSAVPTGPGIVHTTSRARPAPYVFARFRPDGGLVLLDRDDRLHVAPITLDAISPAVGEPLGEAFYFAVASDSQHLAFVAPDGTLRLGTLDDRPSRALPGEVQGLVPLRFVDHDRRLLLAHRTSLPGEIVELELATGATRTRRMLTPADPSGLVGGGVIDVVASGAGRSYAYSYLQILSTLYEARPR